MRRQGRGWTVTRIGRLTLALSLAIFMVAWIGARLPEGSSTAYAAGNILYVDGSVGSTGDCISLATACKTIGDALSKAATNSAITTIDINGANGSFNGVYCEQLTVNLSLTLQAYAASNQPMIDGGAPLFGGGTNSCGTVPGDAPGHSVVTVGNGGSAKPKVALRYLTIQHGDDSAGSGAGGGIILNSGATLAVSHGTIAANTGRGSGNSCPYPYSCQGSGGGVVNDGGILTLTNSTVSGNRAMYCSTNSSTCTADGGGIDNNSGTLILTNSTVNSNQGVYCSSSGSTCTAHGGGIENGSGTLNLINSTVSGNAACGLYCDLNNGVGNGGGIYGGSGSTTTLTNSTFFNNSACQNCFGGPSGTSTGGGIYVGSQATATLTSTTVSSNDACVSSCSGGGLYSIGLAELSNTILAGNIAMSSPDCYGAVNGHPSGPSGPTVGHNVIGNGSGCSQLINNNNGDQVGVSTSQLKLGSLNNNGGPTQTMALGNGSVAIGRADGTTCQTAKITALTPFGGTITVPGPNDLDQRGEPRPPSPSTTCDVGAFDTLGHPIVYVSPKGSDTNTCASAGAPCQHVRVGLATVSRRGTVNVAAGTYCEQVLVDNSVTLQGNGTASSPAVIDGGAGSGNPCGKPPFSEVARNSVVTVGDAGSTAMTVTLRGLTLQNGDASYNPNDSSGYNGQGRGGGIFVYPGATLTVAGSMITANTACSLSNCGFGYGGSSSSPGCMGAPGCGGLGGGIDNLGTTTLVNTIVTGNTACANNACGNFNYNGTIYDGSGFGGGVYNNGKLTVTNSTISNNTTCAGTSCFSTGSQPCSQFCGGWGGGINSGGTLIVTRSAVRDNTVCTTSSCDGFGGGMEIGATTTVSGSTVSGNLVCGGSCTLGAAGGIDNGTESPYGNLTLSNSTVSDNTVCTGACTSAYGGAIVTTDDFQALAPVTSTLINSTVSGNVVCVTSCTSPYGGGIVNQDDTDSNGNSYVFTSLTNTILAGNGGAAGSPDCSGTVSDGSAGANIIGDTTGCNFTGGTGSGDQVGVSAGQLDLGSLGNNRGPTQTMALGPTSVAIGKGDIATCTGAPINSLDQRGSPRNANTRHACDVGAYDTGGPTVRSVSPDTGPASGGTTVTINGTNFVSGATVKFGTTLSGSVTFVSSTQLKAVAPTHSAGSVNVTVKTSGGTSAISVADLYAYGPPTISSFTPSSGITGSTVTVTGTGYARGVVVKFGTLASLPVTILSGTQLKAVVPNGAVPANISVSDAQGTATSASAFTPTLSITGFSPISGPTGTVVTINGRGFNGTSTVKFNGVAAASVTFVSSSQLKAAVPATATTGAITVTNTTAPAGTVRSASAFTVT